SDGKNCTPTCSASVLSCSIAAGRYTSALTTMTFFLRRSFRCRASLAAVVVLPAPCRPAISTTAGAGTLRSSSLAEAPITRVSSSRTTLIRAWPGVSDLSTSWPIARTLMRWIRDWTTGSATSASSNAIRTSRSASVMLDSLSRPRPRTRSMVPDRRWVRDSNMGARQGKTAADYSRAASTGPASCDTLPMTMVLIALAAYLVATVLLVVDLRRESREGWTWLAVAAVAVLLHAGVHILAWRSSGGADMHFFAALSLVGLGMAALTSMVGAGGRMAALGVVGYPVAAATLAGYAGYGHHVVELL